MKGNQLKVVAILATLVFPTGASLAAPPPLRRVVSLDGTWQIAGRFRGQPSNYKLGIPGEGRTPKPDESEKTRGGSGGDRCSWSRSAIGSSGPSVRARGTIGSWAERLPTAHRRRRPAI